MAGTTRLELATSAVTARIVGWIVGWKIRSGLCSNEAANSPLSLILLVADRFQPIPDTSVLLFLNGDVRHGRAWRSTMPVLLAGRYPDHVSRLNFFNGAAPSLHAAHTRGHNQRLAQGMRVPVRPRPRLKSHAAARDTRRFGRLKQRINADRAGEPL